MSDMEEAGAGYRWLSYREIADRLGISVPAAEARVRRGKWTKREGNDGSVRIAVPVSVLEPAHGATGSPQQSQSINDLLAALQAAQEATVGELRRRVEVAEARAKTAEAEAKVAAAARAGAETKWAEAEKLRAVAETKAQAAEDAKTAAEARQAALEDQLEKLRQDRLGEAARLTEATAELTRLRVEIEEMRRPWWSRLFLRRG